MAKFRPLESFPAKLVKLMLRASVTPVEVFAEKHHSAPSVYAFPVEVNERTVKTRWHWVEFTTPEAAQRFKALIHLAHELHELRRSMKHHGHPSAKDVYRVRVSVDDRRGSLRVRSHDAVLEEVLGPEWADAEGSTQASASPGGSLALDGLEFEDPLESIGGKDAV